MTFEMQLLKDKKVRGIEKILKAAPINMGGFPVKQALPLQDQRMFDPFLLLHHASVKYNAKDAAINQGVGPHPHRGFSPVTFVIEGEVHHRDSRGNNQIASKGELQWMNAGAGLIHSERPSMKVVKEEMTQEIIQLWINTPKNSKMLIPSYTYLNREDMPEIESPDAKIQNRLVAGEYASSQQSKINTESDLMLLWSNGSAGGKQSILVPIQFNSMVYLIRGSIVLNGSTVQKESLVILNKQGERIDFEILEDAEFLILCGDPIKEKIVQHGPYVMNTQTEILEAMRDYQMGKMGILIEE